MGRRSWPRLKAQVAPCLAPDSRLAGLVSQSVDGTGKLVVSSRATTVLDTTSRKSARARPSSARHSWPFIVRGRVHTLRYGEWRKKRVAGRAPEIPGIGGRVARQHVEHHHIRRAYRRAPRCALRASSRPERAGGREGGHFRPSNPSACPGASPARPSDDLEPRRSDH